jgi:hypothetical protein
MSGNTGGQIHTFLDGLTGGARPATSLERRRRRADSRHSAPLLGMALFVVGLGVVVLAQWLHPAGPIEDPLVTQPQTTLSETTF